MLGSYHKSDYVVGGIPIVNPMQIIDGKIRPTETMSISQDAANNLSEFRLRVKDIVIGRRGEMGRCAYVLEEQSGWLCGTGSMIVRTTQGIDGQFLQRQFSSPSIISKIENTSVGSTMINLNQATLSNLIIPLPPTLAEQEAIAGALSDVDGLIEALETLITKKRHIKQGTMQELFRPKEGWVEKKLGDIASFFKGKGLPKNQLSPIGKFECIHYGELFTHYREHISHIKSKTDFGHDVIFSKSNDILMPTSDVTPNGLATASCITRNGVVLGGDILVIRPDNQTLNGVYFSYLVNIEREQVMRLVTGSTVYHLYGSDMAKFIFMVPKDINEQTAIAAILSDMDAEITGLEAKLAKTRQLKQGMMGELLTGRIRLI